jgi:hypothetical protein
MKKSHLKEHRVLIAAGAIILTAAALRGGCEVRRDDPDRQPPPVTSASRQERVDQWCATQVQTVSCLEFYADTGLEPPTAPSS